LIFDTAELVTGCGSLFNLHEASYKRFGVLVSGVLGFANSDLGNRP